MTATLYPARRSDPIRRRVGRAHRGNGLRGPDAADSANFAVRRAIAAVVVLVVVAVGAFSVSALVGALVDVGSRPAAASDIAELSADAAVVRIHVAQPGDTLWSIADQYRGEVGQGRFVDALIDANDGTAIQVGQAIRLP